MIDPFYTLVESLLLEMRVVNVSDGNKLVAYGDKIWLYGEESDWTAEQTQDFIRTAKIDLEALDMDFDYAPESLGDLIGEGESLAGWIQDIGRHDIFTGHIRNGALHQENSALNDFSFDPKSSVLIKKVAKQLGLNAAFLSSDDFDNAQKISAPNMKGAPAISIAYHGTTTNYLDSILKIGLRPRSTTNSNSNYDRHKVWHDNEIFFTTKIGKAAYHAIHAASNKGGLPLIISFSIPDPSKVIEDYDVDTESGGQTYSHVPSRQVGMSKSPSIQGKSFGLSREFGIYGYRGSIPPKFIEDRFKIRMTTEHDELDLSEFQEFTKADILEMMRDDDPDSETYGEMMYDSISEFFASI